MICTPTKRRNQNIYKFTKDQQYIDNCLGPVIDEVKKQRPSLGIQSIKLHPDNVRPHFHEDVIRYLQSEGVTVMSHPLNSPDLSPCDFWLFDLIKQNIGDQDGAESLCEANQPTVINKYHVSKVFFVYE